MKPAQSNDNSISAAGPACEEQGPRPFFTRVLHSASGSLRLAHCVWHTVGMNNNTTGNQDIVMGLVLFVAGFIAVATAWGTISYMTAVASWIAGGYLVFRGVTKNRS